MRLIDADALKKKICQRYPHFIDRLALSEVFGAIKNAPSIDAVPVIRCKECKYRCETEDGEYNPEDIVCTYWMSDGLNENDYCSAGGRKENG